MMIGSRASSRDASPALEQYLREIRGDALLTAEEERRLAEAIARGDRDARARLIHGNLRLVVRIARDYVGRGLTMEDLVGEGNLGLLKAVEQFDPRFGTRFSTYASHWIKQAIRHALTNTTAPIRLPAHMVWLLNKWRRAERVLRRRLNRDPSHEEIASELGLSPSQRQMVARALHARQFYYEEGGDGEGASWSPEDTFDPSEPPSARLEAAEEHGCLLHKVAQLDAKERAVLTLRYGLAGDPPQSLQEVGQRLGVTREWVRKLEARAVRKLDGSWHGEGPIESSRPLALQTA
jgi:RNA polymerase primary sigma factor